MEVGYGLTGCQGGICRRVVAGSSNRQGVKTILFRTVDLEGVSRMMRPQAKRRARICAEQSLG